MKSTARILAAALLATALPSAPLAAQDRESAASEASDARWAFENSDVPVDPGFVFGTLDNGMRYILRENATPEGTAIVRMRIGSGSLDETDAERGLSHFLEHMAFNGSTDIPEGEMIKLLEREGLAFGADTNASTGYEAITYMLNLPRNDADLLDTALMLMRETASELTIDPDAVERERGVILAERRDRRNYAQAAREDALAFAAPGARFVDRLPIGTLDVLETASAEQLRALYERTYTPANTVLVIVGDFPVAAMEAAIRDRFADWQGGPAPVDPEVGPVDITRSGLTDIYIDPALSESVAITQPGAWQDRPDIAANRREGALRSVAYGIVNRRLARLARNADAPYRTARFSSGDLFEEARNTSLSISSLDGEWRDGMLAAIREVNQALTHGFTQAEIDEQLANLRTALINAVEGDGTRSNAALAGAAVSLVANDRIPTDASYRLDMFEAMEDEFNPERVLSALREDAAAFDDPLIRFQGRMEPEGGEAALRSAFREGMALPVAAPLDTGASEFAYTDFGAPGVVVSDTRDDRLGFRFITFDNGVRLTLKQTDIREDRIAFRMSLDGGNLLNTQDDPLATYLVSSLPAGGLGQHSQDELQTVLAGRNASLRVANAADAFSFSGGTTPRDLDLQMRVIAAGLTDPGYRREGLERFRRGIDNFFESLNATPASAYGAAQGRVLSGGDPRYSLQSRKAFYDLDYAKLQNVIGDRLQNGAIEIALVGDFEEDAAIEAVATTIGALPPREADFRPREEARLRNFTQERGEVVLTHTGEQDQALIRLVWPTRDDEDLREAIELSLLARVVQLELTDRLREQLGQTYSTSARSSLSRVYPDYGTFTISAPVDANEVPVVREAIAELLRDVRTAPLDPDVIERARKPQLEAYDNALKSLGGWMALAVRAQSQPDRLDRWFAGPDILRALTPEDLRRAADEYLAREKAVEFLVLPETSADEVAAID
ncbi:M16 family metallopeptidase [Erythrobacter sp.]|uniref:M16 family metallopeptidase n=1 Tax=Erythrobacter sp. TaxID=1042 RepID=UPI003C75DC81